MQVYLFFSINSAIFLTLMYQWECKCLFLLSKNLQKLQNEFKYIEEKGA